MDPNYALPYVQLWNLDLQRELGGNLILNVDYNGSKGTRLDTDRALVPWRLSHSSTNPRRVIPS